MPNSQCTKRATGGASRWRAAVIGVALTASAVIWVLRLMRA